MNTIRLSAIIACAVASLAAPGGAGAQPTSTKHVSSESRGSGQALRQGSGQALRQGSGQAYPARPIRFIVPFPPGGGNDIVGRIVAMRLGEALGQQVVVDNRGGAGGTIGTEITAKAPPDGHTILINNISLAVNHTLIPKLPYDTLRDLAPVSLVGRQANIVVVHPGVPVKSMQDLLGLARAKPGQLNYGSGGIGTASHLATEYLKLETRTDMVHVPYKGLGPALIDLMAGRLQLIISTMASALPNVKAGKLRPLAVTTAKRSSFFPELPTMDEAGVKGYEFSTWYGLLAPADTPRRIVNVLNSETARLLQSDGVKGQFAAQGLEPTPSTPEQFGAYLKSEVEKWGKVVKASGAKPE
ncbi:MAG: tripartite tricarboxylate transporter substrate binding protein [Betaproteobacteria bacterium]|nr:tripartite tricarboxylate transporter substrate binding protein [Betaproteobacteria bacterium]